MYEKAIEYYESIGNYFEAAQMRTRQHVYELWKDQTKASINNEIKRLMRRVELTPKTSLEYHKLLNTLFVLEDLGQ